MVKNEVSISVVLATYNGEKYIYEQLESIKNQTLLPDEVIILDDVSNDMTTEIVESFIEKNKLNAWRLIKNKENVGWRKNFFNGFNQAKGKIIFCSDQDDIWDIRKIEKMYNIISKKDGISVLACNIEPFFERDTIQMVNNYQLKKIGKDVLSRVSIYSDGLDIKRPGCSMCFKSEILENVNSLWFEECAHDLLLWGYGVIKGELFVFNESLVKQRRHSAINTPSNEKKAKVRCSTLKVYEKFIKNVINNKKGLALDKKVEEELLKLKGVYLERIDAIENKKILKMLILLKKIKYYPKRMAWIGDLISMFR